MATAKKVVYEKGFSKPVVVDDMKNHDNDPFFIEKLEKAKKTLAKATFPGQIKKQY